MYIKFDLSLHKIHAHNVGYPLAMELLIFTKIYHHLRCWSHSLISNLHAQYIGTKKMC